VLYDSRKNNDSSVEGYIEYYDGYVYFYVTALNEETNKRALEFRRVNVNTKKDELLCIVENAHYTMIGDELIFLESGNKKIYKTDIYGQNRVDLVEVPKYTFGTVHTPLGNYVYYQSVDSLKTNAATIQGELYCVDVKTCEVKKITDTEGLFAYPQIIGNYLYYVKMVENPPEAIGPRGQLSPNTYGGRIYRINLASGEEEIFFEDENIMFITIDNVDKYILAFHNAEPKNKLVIDIETGEVIRKPEQ
jgi:Tol biopolymer transport system component